MGGTYHNCDDGSKSAEARSTDGPVLRGGDARDRGVVRVADAARNLPGAVRGLRGRMMDMARAKPKKEETETKKDEPEFVEPPLIPGKPAFYRWIGYFKVGPGDTV